MSGGPFSNHSLVFPYVGPEEVILQGEVFISRGHLGDVDKRETGLIVFKNSGQDKTLVDDRKIELGTNLL